MPRYKLTIEYDGTGFSGWQRQEGQPSIQQCLEEAIAKFCQQKITTVAAGRTDAGVHALGQIAHMDLAEEKDPFRVTEALNAHLKPHPIGILHVERVADDFHARFSAIKREYLYKIINRRTPLALERKRAWHIMEQLDVKAMRQAAKILAGKHDFTSFRATECQAKSPVKTLDSIEITQNGEEICFRLSAPSFLHHMVRNIVGTLRLVGNGKWSVENVQHALAAKDRSAAGETAPPHGLYLVKITY